MKSTHRPVRTTIVYGLICAALFIPLTFFLGPLLYWSKTLNITLWLFLAGYAFLLARWGRKGPAVIAFPLMLLLAVVFWGLPISAYLILSLGILSWVRSGICFTHSFFRMLVAEICVCLGGAALVAGFSPHSTYSLAIGIFLFFLIQSSYFLIFIPGDEREKDIVTDPFDQARQDLEKILT
ncbi:hypothetical protein ACFL6N_00990 [Thermodesulfobacteriota bacterium]